MIIIMWHIQVWSATSGTVELGQGDPLPYAGHCEFQDEWLVEMFLKSSVFPQKLLLVSWNIFSFQLYAWTLTATSIVECK